MNWFDAAILAVVIGFTFVGFKIGVLRAAIVLGSFIIAAVLASSVAALPASFLEKLIPNPNISYLVGFSLVFLVALVAANVIGGLIYKVVSITPLKWIDSWMGVFLGLLIGIIVVGLVILYLTRSPVSNSDEWLKGSFLTPIVKSITGMIFGEFTREASPASPVAFWSDYMKY